MGILGRITSLFTGSNWLIIPAAFVAIVFHELSHGLVAFALGDRTAKNQNRLSLNPVRHFDLIGLLCMVLFGFGWAKPVPVNPYYFKNKKVGMSLVAIAGPVANLIMAFGGLLFATLILNYVSPGKSAVLLALHNFLIQFLVIFSVLNIGLAVFNLIPLPPLDGSKVLFSLLPNSVYGSILNYERYGMLLLIILINIPWFSDLLVSIREWVFEEITALIVYILF